MDRFEQLFLKYYQKTATEEERLQFAELLKNRKVSDLEKMVETAAENLPAELSLIDGVTADRMVRSILEYKQNVEESMITKREPASIVQYIFKQRWAAAILIFILASGSFLWFLNNRKTTAVDNSRQAMIDIPAGHDGAILTLADGKQVVLDSLGNGVIAHQSGTEIILNNGQLTYDASRAQEVGYNTITTPRGRQYKIILPDGTQVWLNAASSLKYPTAFNDKERMVEINGEAYFEVAKDAVKTFRVNINNQGTIDVLGTNFNINAYNNESNIKTTLLDGKVRVVAALNGNQSVVVLKPGQQAQLTTNSEKSSQQINVIEKADLNNVMAWKNKLFNFEGMTMADIMKQLERWYDIEVVYESAVPNFEFYGELSRNNTLKEILEAFKDSEIHFRLEGRKLIVQK